VDSLTLLTGARVTKWPVAKDAGHPGVRSAGRRMEQGAEELVRSEWAVRIPGVEGARGNPISGINRGRGHLSPFTALIWCRHWKKTGEFLVSTAGGKPYRCMNGHDSVRKRANILSPSDSHADFRWWQFLPKLQSFARQRESLG